VVDHGDSYLMYESDTQVDFDAGGVAAFVIVHGLTSTLRVLLDPKTRFACTLFEDIFEH